MKYRQLGTSDLHVSVVGLGTMSWPGCHFGQSGGGGLSFDRAMVRDQFRAALDAGINLIDTAQGYGQGFAEELLGSFLKESGKRDDVIVVTKVGPLFDQDIRNGRDTDLSAAHIRKSCEASLQRLQVETIDLYLAHRPDLQVPIAETCAAMAELKKEGKIRCFGVSNFSNEQLSAALECGPVVASQIPYSLADRSIERDRLPFCLEHQVGIMAYSPLGKGILTGKYSRDHLPPDSDYRHQRPHFSKDNLSRNLELAATIRGIAPSLGLTPGQLVLAWAIARPGITNVLPGAKTIEQVRENAAAGKVVLDQAVFEKLEQLSS